jgi:putative membrane protein
MPVIPLTLAHGSPHLAAEWWRHWTFEPVTAALLLLSAFMYAAGLATLWRRAGRDRGIRMWEAAAFYAGLLSLALALLSPLAWISEMLFSAHMTQHEVLMLISAPLLVIGRPLQVVHWSLPARGRELTGRWTRTRALSRSWRGLTGPAAAFGLHAAALWSWHIPVLFETALRHPTVHGLQHASFLITAALFWWGMMHGRYGRAGYGAGVLYVFLTAVHSSILGALLAVATSVWYPANSAAAPRLGVTAIEDQHLAGLLMWVPSGVVFIVFGLALFAAWLGESERRTRLGSVG